MKRTGKLHSISRRVAASLALMIALVSALMVAFMYFYASRAASVDLEKKADETLSYLAGMLELPLWNADKETAALIAKTVFQNDLVATLRISDDFGNTLAVMEKPGEERGVERTGKIFHQGVPVGEIKLSLTTKVHRERTGALLASFIFAASLIVVCLMLLSGIVVRALLRQPLGDLNRIVDAYSAGIYEPPSAPMRCLEFQAVGDVLAKMGGRISGQLEQLKEAEQKYRSIFENATEGIFQTSMEGRLLNGNPALAGILGYRYSEELLSSVSDNASNLYVDREQRDKLLSLLLEHVIVNGYEAQMRRKDGRAIWASISARLVRDEAGAPRLIEGFLIDITKRKQAEKVAAESQKLLQDLTDNSGSLICACDPQGRFLFVNRKLANLFGVPRESLIGKTREAIMPPEIASMHRDNDRKVIDTLQPIVTEEENDEPDGKHTYLTVKFPITDPQGNAPWVGGISTDITERKRAEEEIRHLNAELEQRVQERTRQLVASEERMRQFFERQLVGMAITSPEKGWVQVNDKICEMLGYSREELLRLSWAEMTYPEDLAADVAQFGRLLRGEIDSYMLEKRFIRKDGSIIFTNLAVGCVRRGDRSVDYVLALLEDITERKRAEENIRELNEELLQRAKALEDANKELESFSYSVSHDLRTPLRAIDGFSHILLEDYSDKLDDEGRRLLNVVRENTNRMGQLIDDILKFSRSGRTEIIFSSIDMEKMAHAVGAELMASDPGSKLQMEIEPIPPTQGDSAMLHQVFVNLLSNAIKFSRDREVPKIQVGATVKDGETIYFVKDNGAGFDMQYADKLFGVFQRLHSVNEFEGTGIGLAIVKRIVSRHGGRVWAEGKVGEGATLYFSLPNSERGQI